MRRLLVNPRYAGLKVHRGKVTGKGDWTALIDEDTHRGLVAYLSDPARIICTSFVRKYLGSGVYCCGRCGGLMRAAFPGGKGAARTYECKTISMWCGAANRSTNTSNTLCWAICRNRRPAAEGGAAARR